MDLDSSPKNPGRGSSIWTQVQIGLSPIWTFQFGLKSKLEVQKSKSEVQIQQKSKSKVQKIEFMAAAVHRQSAQWSSIFGFNCFVLFLEISFISKSFVLAGYVILSASPLCLLTGLLSSAFPVVFALVSQILSPNSKSKKTRLLPFHITCRRRRRQCRAATLFKGLEGVDMGRTALYIGHWRKVDRMYKLFLLWHCLCLWRCVWNRCEWSGRLSQRAGSS